jgi:hypothetical protein
MVSFQSVCLQNGSKLKNVWDEERDTIPFARKWQWGKRGWGVGEGGRGMGGLGRIFWISELTAWNFSIQNRPGYGNTRPFQHLQYRGRRTV